MPDTSIPPITMYLREIPLHTRPCNVGNTSEPTLATLYGDFSLRLRSDFQNGSTHTGSHLPRLSLTFHGKLLSSSSSFYILNKYRTCIFKCQFLFSNFLYLKMLPPGVLTDFWQLLTNTEQHKTRRHPSGYRLSFM